MILLTAIRLWAAVQAWSLGSWLWSGVSTEWTRNGARESVWTLALACARERRRNV
jgi:hypothetical protein